MTASESWSREGAAVVCRLIVTMCGWPTWDQASGCGTIICLEKLPGINSLAAICASFAKAALQTGETGKSGIMARNSPCAFFNTSGNTRT